MNKEQLQKQLQEIQKEEQIARQKRIKDMFGDYVKWEEDGRMKYGKIWYINEDEYGIYFSVNINVTKSIWWTSDTKYFYEHPQKSYHTSWDVLEKYEYNEDEIIDKIDICTDNINDINIKIEELTQKLEIQKKEEQQKIKEQQILCIHKWWNFYPTWETRKHFCWSTEVEEAECEICGALWYNC